MVFNRLRVRRIRVRLRPQLDALHQVRVRLGTGLRIHRQFAPLARKIERPKLS
jgi:hypothetical protein